MGQCGKLSQEFTLAQSQFSTTLIFFLFLRFMVSGLLYLAQLSLQDFHDAVSIRMIVNSGTVTFTPTKNHQIESSVALVNQISRIPMEKKIDDQVERMRFYFIRKKLSFEIIDPGNDFSTLNSIEISR